MSSSMTCMRLSLIQPKTGTEDEAKRLLEELDAHITSAPGLLFSFVLADGRRFGRVSLWRSTEDANRQAEHTLALRARLRLLAVEKEERLLAVRSGHVPADLVQVIENGGARLRRIA